MGWLLPSQRLMPRLIPLSSMEPLDTLDILPTPPMDMLDTLPTLPMVSVPMVVTMVDIMARGLLMPSLRLMPRLIPLFSTATLDTLDTLLTPPMDMLDTQLTLPMVSVPMVVSMARGLLMPSLRLMPRLILLFSTATLDTL